MCAGPYSQALLGIDGDTSTLIQSQLVKKEDNELLRPGYVRVSLPYYADGATIAYAPGFSAWAPPPALGPTPPALSPLPYTAGTCSPR